MLVQQKDRRQGVRPAPIIIAIVLGAAILGWAFVALPELVVEVARRTSDDVVFHVETAEPVVAVSIDDGPSAATPEILEVLAEHEAGATFFLIGYHVAARPDLARRIVEEGHEAGHHMMSDVPSISLSTLDFRTSFHRMHEILQALDPEAPQLFRPGSGWYDGEMVAEATLHGYRVVLGSVYPFDAQISSPAVAGWYIRRTVRPGAIIVLHDGPERGPRTAETLRRILPHLKRRGLRVVTVSELLEIEHRPSAPRGDGPGPRGFSFYSLDAASPGFPGSPHPEVPCPLARIEPCASLLPRPCYP